MALSTAASSWYRAPFVPYEPDKRLSILIASDVVIFVCSFIHDLWGKMSSLLLHNANCQDII